MLVWLVWFRSSASCNRRVRGGRGGTLVRLRSLRGGKLRKRLPLVIGAVDSHHGMVFFLVKPRRWYDMSVAST